jgi:hypothetical protein
VSEGARLCPYCFAGTPREASSCWLCQTALPPWEQRPPASHGLTAPLGVRPLDAPPGPARAGVFAEPDFVLWAVGTVVACLVMMVVVIDVAVLGGLGLAAIATVLCAPVLVTLATMAWVRRPGARSEAPAEPRPAAPRDEPAPGLRGERPPSDAVRQIVGAIAIGVTAVAAVTLVIGLVVLSLLVLLFLLCLGVLGH